MIIRRLDARNLQLRLRCFFLNLITTSLHWLFGGDACPNLQIHSWLQLTRTAQGAGTWDSFAPSHGYQMPDALNACSKERTSHSTALDSFQHRDPILKDLVLYVLCTKLEDTGAEVRQDHYNRKALATKQNCF